MHTQPLFDIDTPTVADTCVLVRLEQKRVSTRRRADRTTEHRIRQMENDDSLTVNRHLFKKGPVRDVLLLQRKAYDAHKAMTAPWADKGPRLLPARKFQAYADAMESYKEQLAELVPPLLLNWDNLVMQDVRQRSMANQSGASPTEYPSSDQARQQFSLEWYCDPVPHDGDFRVDIPEHIKARNKGRMEAVVDGIRTDLIKRMLEPVEAAAARLAVPIGEKGATFRDTLVTNLWDAVESARDLNVGDDPDVAEMIADLRSVLHTDAATPITLRTQEDARERATAQLKNIANRFKGLG